MKLVVLVIALPILIQGKTKIEKLNAKPVIKSSLDCKKIKCPPIEEPVCMKLKFKNDFTNKTTYIRMINKCELNYMKCHQNVDATIVHMKYCDHSMSKTDHPKLSRAKRAKRSANYEPINKGHKSKVASKTKPKNKVMAENKKNEPAKKNSKPNFKSRTQKPLNKIHRVGQRRHRSDADEKEKTSSESVNAGDSQEEKGKNKEENMFKNKMFDGNMFGKKPFDNGGRFPNKLNKQDLKTDQGTSGDDIGSNEKPQKEENMFKNKMFYGNMFGKNPFGNDDSSSEKPNVQGLKNDQVTSGDDNGSHEKPQKEENMFKNKMFDGNMFGKKPFDNGGRFPNKLNNQDLKTDQGTFGNDNGSNEKPQKEENMFKNEMFDGNMFGGKKPEKPNVQGLKNDQGTSGDDNGSHEKPQKEENMFKNKMFDGNMFGKKPFNNGGSNPKKLNNQGLKNDQGTSGDDNGSNEKPQKEENMFKNKMFDGNMFGKKPFGNGDSSPEKPNVQGLKNDQETSGDDNGSNEKPQEEENMFKNKMFDGNMFGKKPEKPTVQGLKNDQGTSGDDNGSHEKPQKDGMFKGTMFDGNMFGKEPKVQGLKNDQGTSGDDNGSHEKPQKDGMFKSKMFDENMFGKLLTVKPIQQRLKNDQGSSKNENGNSETLHDDGMFKSKIFDSNMFGHNPFDSNQHTAKPKKQRLKIDRGSSKDESGSSEKSKSDNRFIGSIYTGVPLEKIKDMESKMGKLKSKSHSDSDHGTSNDSGNRAKMSQKDKGKDGEAMFNEKNNMFDGNMFKGNMFKGNMFGNNDFSSPQFGSPEDNGATEKGQNSNDNKEYNENDGSQEENHRESDEKSGEDHSGTILDGSPKIEEDEDTMNSDEYDTLCPSVCPARNVMVCGRCHHGVFRTFLSVCHMRMFNCKNPTERMELTSYYPCVASAPYLNSNKDMNMNPKGTLDDPGDHDEVLRFINCRSKGLITDQKNNNNTEYPVITPFDFKKRCDFSVNVPLHREY